MGSLTNAKPIALICTRDREATKPFYRDVLGLTLASEDRFASVFDVDGIQLRLSTVPDWVAHGHTVLGFEVENIEESVKALNAKGVTFNRYDGFNQDALGIWTSPDKDARVAWFNDPDGNVLSVTEF